ncbi:MAG TPA: hypothetical protein VJV78_38605 [Polyangiales bacterium]|nr:hypothetical protein [Polyangiales bacterium]
MSDVLDRLLEAQLQHELARWRGDALDATLAERVRALFRWFGTVKLDDVVTRQQIVGVIERYVIELRVSGGITELSGEMSQLVFGSRASREARLSDVFTPEMYDEFADKVLALESARHALIGLIAQSTTVSALGARLLSLGLLDLIALAIPVPRAQTFAALLGSKILPGLERKLAAALASSQRRRSLGEVFEPERLRAVADDVWDRVSPMRLSELFALIGAQDVEDFVVLVYEFWLRYRKTAYFRRISSELVDHFFAKYGLVTLLELIEDMGVSEAMVCEEVLVLLRPMIEHAAESGALERDIRRNLESFYRSEAARAALEPAG